MLQHDFFWFLHNHPSYHKCLKSYKLWGVKIYKEFLTFSDPKFFFIQIGILSHFGILEHLKKIKVRKSRKNFRPSGFFLSFREYQNDSKFDLLNNQDQKKLGGQKK